MSRYHTAATSRLSRGMRAEAKERLDDTVETNRKAADDLRQAVAERKLNSGQQVPDRIRHEEGTNAREGG